MRLLLGSGQLAEVVRSRTRYGGRTRVSDLRGRRPIRLDEGSVCRLPRVLQDFLAPVALALSGCLRHPIGLWPGLKLGSTASPGGQGSAGGSRGGAQPAPRLASVRLPGPCVSLCAHEFLSYPLSLLGESFSPLLRGLQLMMVAAKSLQS